MYDKIYIITKSRRDLNFLKDTCEIVKFKKMENFEFFANDNELVFFFPDGKEIKNPPKIYAKNILNFNLEAIKTCSNKIECRRKLEMSNAPIPKTWYRIQNARVPYIIRREYHSMGMGLQIIRKGRDHRQQERIIKNKHRLYFSELIDVEKEYRAFVLDGQIFLIFDRDWQGDIESTLKQRESVRANMLDFNRREASNEISKEHRQLCIDATKAVDLDYGAVDFVIDKSGKLYVLEINTTPFMNGQIVKDALIKAFEDLKNGIPITPFKYEVENDGK